MSIFQRFRFPAEFSEDVNKILAITDEQFELLQNSVGALFSDFGALAKDHRILDDIRTHESAVDRIEQKLYDSIFDMDITLAEKMQLFQFVEWLADLSDIIENIADKIQIMLITRKA
jgi:predicted phosphate transport protein (TIGR00153 family)